MNTSPAFHPLGQQSGWYRALTLRERVESRPAWSALDPQAEQQARTKLAQWQGQNPFQSGSFFNERLAQDGITTDDLLYLLAETPESLRTRVPVPAWLESIEQAFAEFTEDLRSDFSPTFAADDPTAVLAAVIQPLLQQGQRRLQVGLEEIAARYSVPRCEMKSVLQSLAERVMEMVSFVMTPTFLAELKSAATSGQLAGDTPRARLQNYVQGLAAPASALALLEKHCVLARQLTMSVDYWVETSLEMLRRLAADWPMIEAAFALEQAGGLVQVRAGLGDNHAGGRSVMCLTFRSGQQIIYKPRSLALDQHFQELLSWLNGQGLEPTVQTFQVLERGEYGWLPYLVADDCTSEAQVQRFYTRQGIYLALFYLLDATDMHAGNLLACGEHPLFIDLETLFHPWRVDDCSANAGQPAEAALLHSVMRTGMVPQRVWGSEQAEGVDMSGLGAQSGQRSPRALPRWVDIGTDQMRQVWEKQNLSLMHNRPRLNGQEVETLPYLPQILDGFTRTYRLLMEKRQSIQEKILPRFAQDALRFVARPTDIYARFWQESLRPTRLRDAWERERHVDRLWVGITSQPYMKSLIPAERADLLNGDIPRFTTTPTSRDLFSSQGECIPNFFPLPALQQVQQRLSQMSERDLAFQCRVITNAFTCSLPASDLEVSTPASAAEITGQRLLAGACRIGDWLREQALHDGECAGWVGISQISPQSRILAPAQMDLYDGLAGITFFLAYLAAQTGNTRYRHLAETALNGLRAFLRQAQARPHLQNIGAFSGWSAPIYLLTHLGSLWEEASLLTEAEAIVDLLPDLIARDRQFDVMNGAAGCLLVLLNLYQQTASPRLLEVALHCGQHLLAFAQPMPVGRGWKLAQQPVPLTGFAHGAAGIALSLLKLAALSGETAFHACALEAFAYERSLFSPAQGNWPDLRAQAGEHSFMVAWCHGAAGIALSRIAALPYTQDPLCHAEISTALGTISAASQQASTDPTLCHGLAGLLETRLTAEQNGVLVDDAAGQIKCLANRLLALLETQPEQSRRSWWSESPSFMTGLAGLGYTLLRLNAPAHLPSVLTLAGPTISHRRTSQC